MFLRDAPCLNNISYSKLKVRSGRVGQGRAYWVPNDLWGLFCSVLFWSISNQEGVEYDTIHICVCVCVSVRVLMSVQCNEWIEGKEVLNARDEEIRGAWS